MIYLNRVLRVLTVILIDPVEQILAESRYNTLLLLSLAHHCVTLARPRLTVGKDTHVVTYKKSYFFQLWDQFTNHQSSKAIGCQ